MKAWKLLILVLALSGAAFSQVKLKVDSLNGTCYVNSTLAAAVTCAGSSGVIEVPTASIVPALTANVTVPSGVTLRFAGGASCITTSGWTLTINGPLVAPPQKIFCGSGTVVLGTSVPLAPVEWFGAVGDWNGSTGTDNTTAIQACFSSMTNGKCTLLGKSYMTSSALSVTKSILGLIGVSPGSPASASYPKPSASEIVQTCAACDIIDVTGSNSSNAVAFNVFKNVTLSRSVTPSGIAKGLSLVFADSPIIDGVTSQDSTSCFYLKGVNATSALERVQNSFAVWGANGVAEATGNLFGWQIDSTDGSTSNSLYLQNTGAVSSFSHNGTSATYGYYISGSQTHDVFFYQANASTVDYGVYVNASSSSFANSADIHLLSSVLDGCNITCLYETGAGGTLSVTGGWFAVEAGSTHAVIDLENSANVSIVNATLYFPGGTGGGILAHGGNSIQIVGTKFAGLDAGTAITINNISNGVIADNDAGGVTATSIISLISATYIAVSSNSLSGTATNGILIDSASNHITGLETNTCGGSGGTVTNCINDSGGNLYSSNRPYCGGTVAVSSGFGTGTLGAHTNGSCGFFVTTSTGGGSTGAMTLPSNANGWLCLAANQSRADYVSQTSSTSNSATFQNWGTTFSATNWTSGDIIFFSCTGVGP